MHRVLMSTANTSTASRRDDYLRFVLPRREGERFIIDDKVAVGISPDRGIGEARVKLAINAPRDYALFALQNNGFIKAEQLEPTATQPQVWNIEKLNAAGPLVILTLLGIVNWTAGISIQTLDVDSIVPEEFLRTPLSLDEDTGYLARVLKLDEQFGIFEPDPEAVIRYTP